MKAKRTCLLTYGLTHRKTKLIAQRNRSDDDQGKHGRQKKNVHKASSGEMKWSGSSVHKRPYELADSRKKQQAGIASRQLKGRCNRFHALVGALWLIANLRPFLADSSFLEKSPETHE